MVQLPNGLNIPAAIRDVYDTLYAARQLLQPVAITPRSQEGLAKLDHALRSIYSAMQMIEVWGPLLEGNDDLAKVMSQAMAGEPITDDKARRLLASMGLDPDQLNLPNGDNPR